MLSSRVSGPRSRGLLGAALFALLALGLLAPLSAQGTPDIYLHYKLDRQAIPGWAQDTPLTLRVVVGPSAPAVLVNGNGAYVAATYDPARGDVQFTTTASDIIVRVTGAQSDTIGFGQASITALREDKAWAFSLTLDDGYLSVYTNAKPLLDRYGYPASAAIFAGRTGSPGFMGPAELQALVSDGWALNNHTYSHYYVSDFPNTEAVVRDIARASEVISDAVPGYAVHGFTAPFHDPNYNLIVAANSESLALFLAEGLGSQAWRQVEGFIYGKDNFLIGRRALQHLDPLLDEMHNKVVAEPDKHFWLTLDGHAVVPACDPVEIASDYLYAHYGAGGTDEVWVAPTIEVYRYILAHDSATISRLPDADPQLMQEPPPVTPSPTPTVVPPTDRFTLTLQQGVDSYDGTTDTYIDAYAATAVHDDPVFPNTGLAMRSGDIMFPLIQFDLGTIPPQATIVSATLSLYSSWHNNAQPTCGRAYGLLRPWKETEATWYASTLTDTWGLPGASDPATDRDATSPALRRFVYAEGQRYDFTVDWLVKRWVSVPASNHGLLLYPSGEWATRFDFASSEAQEVAHRPRLTVVYELPAGPTATPTVTPTPTASPTPGTPTATPTATATPGGPSPAPSATATETPFTGTPTPSATPSITPTPTATVAPGLSAEAEGGALVPPMATVADAMASSCAYVTTPYLSGQGGAVTIEFAVPQAGQYLVWGRVFAPDALSDSFFVSVDGMPDFVWDLPPGGWHWRVVSARGGDEPAVFAWDAGAHRVLVRGREGGARLDVMAAALEGEPAPATVVPCTTLPSPTATATPTPTVRATNTPTPPWPPWVSLVFLPVLR